ncbi:hypothetical protein BH23BAC1_BH23BAC1_11540 [soil metagenome]
MGVTAKKTLSAVALEQFAAMAHATARSLNGTFLSMEEIECKDLLDFAKKMDELTGPQRAIALLDFAQKCMTKVATELKTIKNKIEKSDLDFSRITNYKNIFIALVEVCNSTTGAPISALLPLLEAITGRVIYRREMWNELKKVLREKQNDETQTFLQIVRKVRDTGRIVGRRVPHKVISRPLLIKGLEFDHSIILDADKLSEKELYVALTRGSYELSIVSAKKQLYNAVKGAAATGHLGVSQNDK